jgi:hypothetical protein
MSSSSIDFVSPQLAQRAALVLASFAFWSVLFLSIYSRPTSSRLEEKAEKLEIQVRVHKAELATRVCAIGHAVILSLGSFYITFLKSNSSLRIYSLTNTSTWPGFTAENELAIWITCISAGYFVGDFILCFVQMEEHGLQFVIHAIVGLVGCMEVIIHNECLIYMMFIMMFEFSTPFLHFRWLLIEYGMKDSKEYLYNGLCLVAMFTWFRLVFGVPVLLQFSYKINTYPENLRHSYFMRLVLTAAALSLTTLNITWGTALWKGMFKALGMSGSKPIKSEIEKEE